MKLIKRADWGAPATSGAGSIANTRGVKIHYMGSHYTSHAHSRCAGQVLAVRRSHMANTKENYADIAYNYVVCEHGYVFEGRGVNKRTGANGNAALNTAHYSVLALLGSSGMTEPTADMLNGIVDAVEHLRAHGNAGNEVLGHRDGHPTQCPGGPLYAWVSAGAQRPGVDQGDDKPSTPAPSTPADPYARGLPQVGKRSPSTVALQRELQRVGYMASSVKRDANYGPRTQDAVAAFHDANPQFKSAPGRRPQIGPLGWAFLRKMRKGAGSPAPSTPSTPTVNLSRLIAAARRDPGLPQGGTTHAADVRVVERALAAEGLLNSRWASDGSFGSMSVAAYAAWQRRCGYTGRDADGIPGAASLRKLGVKHGFRVG
ncbi:N-acetylmuramoyl-L-alanine amidase [Streptomyces sp. SM12]|uniref:peptidoglycan recognition protein family protein n=1 Tax=Streptomyces sp. SM12 TaxID=1071602 RepID=UPI0015E1A6A0|nr:N-acetylmuramoyl-L-alanine amidase [Streptomyces sp. SM12]